MDAFERARLIAPAALLLGGLLSLVGSLLPWSTCPDTSCGDGGVGLQVLVHRSGIDVGAGLVTALLALFLVAVGIGALMHRERSQFRNQAVAAAVVSFLIVTTYIFRAHVLPAPLLYGPDRGALLVAGGSVIALAGALRWRPSVPRRVAVHPSVRG